MRLQIRITPQHKQGPFAEPLCRAHSRRLNRRRRPHIRHEGLCLALERCWGCRCSFFCGGGGLFWGRSHHHFGVCRFLLGGGGGGVCFGEGFKGKPKGTPEVPKALRQTACVKGGIRFGDFPVGFPLRLYHRGYPKS